MLCTQYTYVQFQRLYHDISIALLNCITTFYIMYHDYHGITSTHRLLHRCTVTTRVKLQKQLCRTPLMHARSYQLGGDSVRTLLLMYQVMPDASKLCQKSEYSLCYRSMHSPSHLRYIQALNSSPSPQVFQQICWH